jgi:hypothetical protein
MITVSGGCGNGRRYRAAQPGVVAMVARPRNGVAQI